MNVPRTGRARGVALRGLVLAGAALVATSALSGCTKKAPPAPAAATSRFAALGTAGCQREVELPEGVVLAAHVVSDRGESDTFFVNQDGRVARGREVVDVGKARVQQLIGDLEATGIATIPEGCWQNDRSVPDAGHYAASFRRAGATYTFAESSASRPPPEVEAANGVWWAFWASVSGELHEKELASLEAGAGDGGAVVRAGDGGAAVDAGAADAGKAGDAGGGGGRGDGGRLTR